MKFDDVGVEGLGGVIDSESRLSAEAPASLFYQHIVLISYIIVSNAMPCIMP